MTSRVLLLGGCAVMHLAGVVPAHAQARDTVTLPALQQSAAARDPRTRQESLLARQSELRRRTIAGDLLPAAVFETLAQYQSDVARVPLPAAPSPPHDTYDARLALTQRVFDPTVAARQRLERAQLEHSLSGVRSTLYTKRQQVNEAFFGALRAQVQLDELRAGVAAIEAQIDVAAARVREGAALPSEELALRAEVLRRRQLVAEAGIQLGAALEILGSLTGVPIDSATRLVMPAVETRDIPTSRSGDDAGARPEYAQFARAREVLREQERLRASQDLPRASLFGRAGYGQPGLNPLNDTFDSYWLAGLQVQWAPWHWGAGRRDREVMAAQREIVATEEAAFTEQLQRSAVQDRAVIDRLEAAVRLDDEIIAARAQIAEETRVRYGEAAVTSAEYVERQSELLGARLTRALHRVELAQARVRLLTTLGMELR